MKDWKPADKLGNKLVKELDRYSELAIVATDEAVKDAGLTLDEEIVRGLSEGEPKTVLAKRLARSFSLGRAEVYDRVVELSSTE